MAEIGTGREVIEEGEDGGGGGHEVAGDGDDGRELVLAHHLGDLHLFVTERNEADRRGEPLNRKFMKSSLYLCYIFKLIYFSEESVHKDPGLEFQILDPRARCGWTLS